MSLLVLIGVLVAHAAAMLWLGYPLPAVLTLGLATMLALAGAAAEALKQWREGFNLNLLTARVAALELSNKQVQADFEALRTRNALERMGG